MNSILPVTYHIESVSYHGAFLHISIVQVKYKGDLKKIHKPVTDMAESLSMQHNLSTSKLASDVRALQPASYPSHQNCFISHTVTVKYHIFM